MILTVFTLNWENAVSCVSIRGVTLKSWNGCRWTIKRARMTDAASTRAEHQSVVSSSTYRCINCTRVAPDNICPRRTKHRNKPRVRWRARASSDFSGSRRAETRDATFVFGNFAYETPYLNSQECYSLCMKSPEFLAIYVGIMSCL